VNQIIGVADMKISNNPEDLLITYSLGSCLGITMHDAQAGVGGMVHCMLPLSKLDAHKAQLNPSMFIDTGVIAMLQQLFDLGAQRKRLRTSVAGGSQMLESHGLFNIGERNIIVLRKVLWKNDLLIAAQEVGGSIPRTLSLEIGTGRTRLRSGGQERDF
jgi:chemotaxis protein CheD